jgi:hypothetical protein
MGVLIMKEKLMELFESNEELFNQTIEELDSYNGYLGDDRYYEMDMLSEFYYGTDPIELLNRAYFGCDSETWHTDSSGNKIYGAFNPNREYFSYNGYGNLVSSDYKDYSAYLDDYFIDAVIDNQDYLYLDDEITAILEADNDEIL